MNVPVGSAARRRPVTLADIAREAGTSPSTASRALSGHGYGSVAARASVLAAAERLGYVPNAVGGFRLGNTYRGGEVSNHLFGIAIDIDPERNPCCGCVDPWPSHPLCKVAGASIYEKTSLPKCWPASNRSA